MARLGYLIPEFPRQTHILFWREIEQLRAMGVDPVMFSTRRPPENACPHAFAEEGRRITTYLFPPPTLAAIFFLLIHPIGFFRALMSWRQISGTTRRRIRALGLLLCAAQLCRLAKKSDVSHIHVQSCADSAIVTMFARRLGGPTYSMTMLNPLPVHGPDQKLKWRHAKFCILLTKQMHEEVIRTLAGSLPPGVFLAPLGVDHTKYKRSTPYVPWTPAAGTCKIFSCARLNPCKGFDVLIRSIGKLRDAGRDVQLLIAGEDFDSGTGQYRRNLEQLRAELKLEDRVSMPGAMSEAAIREHLEQSHLFALASHEEPLGVVILEAMAMSIPVAATKAGGVPEIITSEEIGLLVLPANPQAMADAISRYMDNPALAATCSANGRQTVVDRFGSDLSAKVIRDER
ncbi:exopolysaccharide biosynthesis GT4 family glycosyltransferase EpsE [Zavarzinella formosa]|uniref:exopolysaccharide biosynthesis GT4 family glycosyltransferase EpsE n=1 Tax=Zavarzinella formosa TaxID=360055 RepID=UPI00031010DE|nr:exopolysaccharide biosynthesis GT4 family glycosyltransferase EpsE [Zavarzinella formosa]